MNSGSTDAERCCSPASYARPSEQVEDRKVSWLLGPVRSASAQVKVGIEQLHEASGLPWWATLALVGSGLRVVTLPLSLRAAATVKNIMKGGEVASKQVTHMLGDAQLAGISPRLLPHARRQKLLRRRLAPGSTNAAWLLAPLLQVQSAPRTRCNAMCAAHVVLAFIKYLC